MVSLYECDVHWNWDWNFESHVMSQVVLLSLSMTLAIGVFVLGTAKLPTIKPDEVRGNAVSGGPWPLNKLKSFIKLRTQYHSLNT